MSTCVHVNKCAKAVYHDAASHTVEYILYGLLWLNENAVRAELCMFSILRAMYLFYQQVQQTYPDDDLHNVTTNDS